MAASPDISPNETIWPPTLSIDGLIPRLNETGSPTEVGIAYTLGGGPYTSSVTISINPQIPLLSVGTEFLNLQVVLVGGYTLSKVVERLMLRAGYIAAQFDTSGIANIDTALRGLALSQSAPTRSTMEMLMAMYFFDAKVSDKIYFVQRAAAAGASIPYVDLGYAAPEEKLDPLAFRQAQDADIPGALALTYLNYDQDHATDVQIADRLLSLSDSVAQMQAPIVLKPTEAKGMADSILLDQTVGMITAKVSVSSSYARLEPTDVVLVTDAEGTAWRMRVARREDSFPLVILDLVLDDSTVFSASGTTDTSYALQTSVGGISEALLAQIVHAFWSGT